ncbi:MAG: hypothetical protein ACI9G1_000406 [Pirellulaceae bacterium]|jgi:hypothetical protein
MNRSFTDPTRIGFAFLQLHCDQLAPKADPRFVGLWGPTANPRTLEIDGTKYDASLKKGGQTGLVVQHNWRQRLQTIRESGPRRRSTAKQLKIIAWGRTAHPRSAHQLSKDQAISSNMTLLKKGIAETLSPVMFRLLPQHSTRIVCSANEEKIQTTPRFPRHRM